MAVFYEVNLEIIRLLKKENIYRWQIAERIGIHETTFCRWFRKELTPEQVQQILTAVEEIKKQRLKER